MGGFEKGFSLKDGWSATWYLKAKVGHEIGDVSIGVGNWPDKSPIYLIVERNFKEALKNFFSSKIEHSNMMAVSCGHDRGSSMLRRAKILHTEDCFYCCCWSCCSSPVMSTAISSDKDASRERHNYQIYKRELLKPFSNPCPIGHNFLEIVTQKLRAQMCNFTYYFSISLDSKKLKILFCVVQQKDF